LHGNLTRLLLALLWAAACDDPPPAGPSLDDLPPLPAPVVAPTAPAAAAAPVRALRVAWVGEVRGEVEPCGCPTLPYGGFVRRGRLLDTLRAGGPLLHLDAGDTLLKGFFTQREERAAERARLVLRLSAEVGVDAWSPSLADVLALGPDGLAAVRAGRWPAPPVVSASFVQADGTPLFSPARRAEVGGAVVGLVGLASAEVPVPPALGLQAAPVLPAFEAGLRALGDAPLDLVVAFGSLNAADAAALAAHPRVDLILKTRGDAVDAPAWPAGPDGAAVLETPDRGRYLSETSLRLGGPPGAPVALAPDPDAWKDLALLRGQPTLRPEAAARRDALEAALDAAGAGRTLLHHAELPLGNDLDGESPVAPVLATWKDAVLARAAVQAAAPPTPAEPGYASSGACVNCHPDQFARWAYTDHAKAWTSLVKRRSDTNPECVACHATGWAEPGGMGTLTNRDVRRFKAVQCESCHGPLRGHPEDPSVRPRPIEPGACVSCHDAANSPDFDFATHLPRATCTPQAAAATPPPTPPTTPP
jgi:hypothetical protein